MKREIKFRGKITSDNLEELISYELEIAHKDGWIEGSFVEPNIITGRVADIDWEYFATEWWAKVILETVGQFTGLKDKNGIEIYEGDIVRYYQPYSKTFHTHIVRWDGMFACFGLFKQDSKWCVENDWLKIEEIEVIGNIHDNPEILN